MLQTYHTNISKQLTKSPKLYFMDAGFCAWMDGWSSPEVLMNGALSDMKGVQSIPPGKAEIKPGVVLCTATELLPLGRWNVAFPISAL